MTTLRTGDADDWQEGLKVESAANNVVGLYGFVDVSGLFLQQKTVGGQR